MTVTLTPEVLALLRQRAEQDQVLYNPKEILALLDRVEALEAKWERPSHWRCDGCGHTVTPRNGREPDAHPSCGGVWIRLG